MELIIILILWIIPVVFGTYIGNQKGEGFISFVLLLLLGWIWFPVVLLSRGNRKRCRSCYEWMNKKAVICPHCRKES